MEKSQEENDQSNSTSSKSPISIHTQNISPLNKKTKFPTLFSQGRGKKNKKQKRFCLNCLWMIPRSKIT